MTPATETTITPHELSEIRSYIQQRSGIVFDESRARFFTTRLREHMTQKKLGRGADLLRVVKNSNAAYDQLLERVLTQETSFFRYPAIYRALGGLVLPEIHAAKFWSNPRSLRVWSAGCSTGEEPYSIGMTICDELECVDAWDVQILATDVSRQALEIAEAGRYSRRDLAALTPQQIEAYWVRTGGEYTIRPKLRDKITFAPMNLAQMVYMGRFDCIFCMNVLIYFSEELRAGLIQRFSNYLEPGGYLFLGHAESVAKSGVELDPIVCGDSLIYRKASSRTSAAGGRR
jgi:chemotaxis protein methyltransferase CheR